MVRLINQRGDFSFYDDKSFTFLVRVAGRLSGGRRVSGSGVAELGWRRRGARMRGNAVIDEAAAAASWW